ncbi:uncharacterized protein LOC135428819 [Drosophila montana]|uniref:uncharacterized protein LOC135428819 n=1 Tax=Drosophila montana TaxID=40370 RepID=UPI00313DB445
MSVRRTRKHTLTDEERLDRLYPLPPQPPDQCRDAFLRELLPPQEPISYGSVEFMEEASITSDDSILSKQVGSGVEARIVDEFVKHRAAIIPSRQARLSIKPVLQDDKLPTSVLNKMLTERYGSIAKAIGFVAVLFQLTELKNRMAVVREMWRLKSNVDRSIRMFSWSLKDYFMRFNIRNTVYLDTIELELKGQMDCFKFRMDLKEVIRLIDAVYEDFKAKRNICSRSMLVIKDAQVDVMELLSSSQREAEAHHNQLTKAMQQTSRFGNPGGQAKIHYMDCLAPIEARYKINWAQSIMEQSNLHDEFRNKEISDQLNYFKENLTEVRYLCDTTNLAYDLEINNYKGRIAETEQAYEESMELVDNEINLTRNKLIKVKDDLAFCKSQVPVFHRKIAEVREILTSQEEEPKRVTERISTRVSKKISKNLRKG